MNYKLPNDPHMLVSFLNMMFRDRYASLEEFCTVNDADIESIKKKLASAVYEYDEK